MAWQGEETTEKTRQGKRLILPHGAAVGQLFKGANSVSLARYCPWLKR